MIPWIEKYRPKSLDEISHQGEVVSILKKSLETKNLPHLLFFGPPGTGKTSTILAIAQELYGPDVYKERVLELNASDERGIGVIRSKVKTFARSSLSSPNYKLIILDEADSMTIDAQTALRRMMEEFSKTTRFCIICNYVTKIIEALSSRCAKFRFKPLHFEVMKERIKFICDKEKIPYSDELVKSLDKVSEGDLRRAINFLQNGFRMYGDALTANGIVEIAGAIPSQVIDDILSCKTFEDVERITNEIVNNGYPAMQIFSQLFSEIANYDKFNDLRKAKIIERIAIAEKCLVDGADEQLQLMHLLTFIIQ